MNVNNGVVLRRRLLAGGQVQGVGFRPFVYRLAHEHGLSGSVGNTADGVCIEVQGSASAVEAFGHDLRRKLPPLARLFSCVEEALPCVPGENAFVITASDEHHEHRGHHVLISADVGTCVHCQADMAEPENRRYRYPFTNCTNCGPRYTITRAIPYDRATTSMACFPLCPQCQAEYENPLDRRFHAQPNACPQCGPRVWAVDKSTPGGRPELEGETAIIALAHALRAGKVAAIKGLGGFHLACDAMNVAAVTLLRTRKHRPHKALAVMVPDLFTARKLAVIGSAEERLLCSAEKPIVLCQRLPGMLPGAIAPDVNTVGLMLPYTPLHMVLLDLYARILPPAELAALVMTSGNAKGEPLCLGNREALQRLAHIADFFLLHNRDILVRTDDSVVRPLPAIDGPADSGSSAGSASSADSGSSGSLDCPDPPPLFLRRARGYVPRPVLLESTGPCVLGVGPELKATLCLTRGNTAFVGQHTGDLQNMETLRFYEEVARHLESILEVRPEAVVCDLHPDFLSTAFAHALAAERGIACWPLQHHFAHAWSVLAEHQHKGPALALTLDGTGLGEDGTIWGGELLYVDTSTRAQQRLGRLRPFALPGGEAAIREPWRIALALGHAGTDCPEAMAVTEMLQRKVHCPLTSSVGRLFDALSAALGLCTHITYEGQAAIRLEAAQAGLGWTGAGGVGAGFATVVEKCGDLWELDTQHLFTQAVTAGQSVPLAARRFHVGLACGLAEMALSAARETDVSTVAVSGGVMQNATLAALLPWMLEQRGLRVLLHRDIPAHDGGISLGQAWWGQCRLR